jgi:hypothetical protein
MENNKKIRDLYELYLELGNIPVRCNGKIKNFLSGLHPPPTLSVASTRPPGTCISPSNHPLSRHPPLYAKAFAYLTCWQRTHMTKFKPMGMSGDADLWCSFCHPLPLTLMEHMHETTFCNNMYMMQLHKL